MYTFLKSQTASLVATAADFSLTFLCVELIGLWYGTASVLGTVFGAMVHFSISRKWVFLAGRGRLQGKVHLDVGGSLLHDPELFLHSSQHLQAMLTILKVSFHLDQ
jgi:hypothetical protein